MYNAEPLWRKFYIARKTFRFLKHYTDSILFKISSPLSSVVWIFSSVFNSYSDPLSYLAVAVLVLPAIYYYLMFSPFNVTINWNQVKPSGNYTQRANQRGQIYINKQSNTAQVTVNVLFDSHMDAYELEIDSDYGIEVYPGASDPPAGAEYDEEKNIIKADNVDNPQFFFTLNIEHDSDLTLHDPNIRIKDVYEYDLGLLEHLPNKFLDLFRRKPTIIRFSFS